MGIILMTVGIIILCIINYGKFKTEIIQKQMKKSILENSVVNEKENEELNISELNLFNEGEQDSEYSEQDDEVESNQLKENTASSTNKDNSNNISKESTDNKDVSKEENIKNAYENCIGILSIPKLDLEVAISEGVTMNNLKYSVAHYSNSAGLGEKGNCSIAGHRSYSYNEFFNRLDEINKGDYIYIETAKNKFTYIVYDSFVVQPTETWVLDSREKYEITLITCTPIRVATHRLIIKGELVESIEKE